MMVATKLFPSKVSRHFRDIQEAARFAARTADSRTKVAKYTDQDSRVVVTYPVITKRRRMFFDEKENRRVRNRPARIVELPDR